MPAARGPAPRYRHGRGRTGPPARRGFTPGLMKIQHANVGDANVRHAGIGHAIVRHASVRHATFALIAAALAVCCLCPAGTAATPNPESHKRMVIIDQDAYGPAGSNLQAILLLLQASDVEVLGITIVSGDGWPTEGASEPLPLAPTA